MALGDRPTPTWWADAKLGIFVHWGPYSVPAFAPTGDDPFTLAKDHGWEYANANTPYAEWYQNAVAIGDSPAAAHHAEVWGDAPYFDFGPRFAAAADGWAADAWADLFAAAGARYGVLTTKHHDGFLLWPSATPNPFRAAWQTTRDLTGDFTAALRSKGLEVGLYYSGGLDWTFGGLPIRDFPSMIQAIPQSAEYGAYADAHWRELVLRYRPKVLWNDIAYPGTGDSPALFDWYYEQVPDGLVNNRFDFLGVSAGTAHADFITPEYSNPDEVPEHPWEVCRGIGGSFGVNANETEADLLSVPELVRLLVDIVSKGGNLLLDVGPAADGSIWAAYAERLLGLGWWLRTNGEAIYGTRPWRVPSATTPDGLPVRFTSKGDAVYATILDPVGSSVVLPEVSGDGHVVRLLAAPGAPLACTPVDGGLEVVLPDRAPRDHAVTFAVTPRP